jgi:hypothetical protein
MESGKIDVALSYNDIRAKVQPSPNVYALNAYYGEQGNCCELKNKTEN